jgi:hypothetical protein
MKNYFISLILGLLLSCSAKETEVKIEINRFIDEPIIPPFLEEEIGSNINGPSLIKAPAWIKSPLGKYYLYFADHKGDRIKLAFAENLEGPWKIYTGGTLQLKDSHFLTQRPEIPDDFDVNELGVRDVHRDHIGHIPKKIDDLTYPHIASPDVHVDEINQRIVMYYHGLDEFGLQKTRVAVSNDGINFLARKKIVGWPYFRKFSYKDLDYAISMPGVIYKNSGDLEDFTIVNQIMDEDTRHSAVMVDEDKLLIFYTRKGDKPERILLTTIDLTLPSPLWKTSKPIEVLKPEKEWEGASLPLYKSVASAINIPANQLRDPAIFIEDDKNYLLYSIRGENGIAIVEFSITNAK